MNYDGRVVFKIDGDDSGLKKTINSTEQSLGGLKSAIVKLGLGAVLTKTFTAGAKASAEFESSLAKASTLFGSVAVDTDNLNKKILELSSATGQTAASIGNSLYNALSAGVDVTEDMGTAMTFLENATKLSVAGFTDVDTAVTATAKVINAYGMNMEDAARVSEVLMETQNLGITTVNELGSALATVTPIAASFGVEFEQVGASLALMTKQGTDTATATTQLRGLIQELGQSGTKASKNLQKAFKAAGLEYKDFAEYMKDPDNNLQGAIQLLAEYADDANLKLSDMFSNTRAGVGALQLAQDEMGIFNTFMEDMASDTTLVQDAYDKMMDTRANKWNRLKTQLKNITIGFTLTEGTQGILDGLLSWASDMLSTIEKNMPKIQAYINIFLKFAELALAEIKKKVKDILESPIIKPILDFTDQTFKELKAAFESGDWSKVLGVTVKIATIFVALKAGADLLSGLMSSLVTATGLSKSSLGVLALAGLTIYSNVKAVQAGDKSWADFASDMVAALIPAVAAYGITGSVTASGLVFTISANLGFGNVLKSWGNTVGDWLFPKVAAARENTYKTLTEGAIQQMIDASFINENKDSIANWSNAKWSDIINSKYKSEDGKKYTWTEVIAGIEGSGLDKAKQAGMLAGTEVGEKIVEGIGWAALGVDMQNITEEAGELFIQIFKSVMGIQSPSKVFKEIGGYIVAGLGEGVTEAGEVAETMAQDFLDGFKDELGIHSPATEFEDAGKDIVEGLKEGTVTWDEAWKALVEESKKYLEEINKEIEKANLEVPPPAPEDEQDSVLEPTKWQKFLSDLRSAPGEIGSAIKGNLSAGFKSFIDDLTDSEARIGIWKDAFSSAFEAIGSGFEELGEAIVEGEADWKIFAKAGISAIATLLEALGKELAVEAIAALVAENYPKAILAGAGSASAFTAAGLVKGWANSFERGGIVGGSGITGDRHVVFANAGELILSKAQQGAIASQLSTRGGSNITIAFNGQVFGDQQSISEYVYDGIRNAQREGAIPSWQQ